MALPRAAAAVVLAAVALAACGSSSGSSPPPVEQPFTGGWLPVAGMACANESATGIGVSFGRSDAVLFYLSPGGACWGSTACPSSVLRAFGSADYGLLNQPLVLSGTIFDRGSAANPFAEWTYVFVPYCTGDVHAGATVAVHGGERWDHRGWANLRAAVAATTSTLPRPLEVVVAGSSAGGFGTLAAYDLLRAEWDQAGGTTAVLLDDSAPTFVGTAMPPALLARWWDVWGLASTIGSTCPACRTDLSAIWPTLHARHPQDRLALVSTLQDATMIGFFADPDLAIAPQTGPEFEASLDELVRTVGTLEGAFGTYRIGGAAATKHAVLARDPTNPFATTFLQSPQGPPLLDWISAMIQLDPAWAPSTSP